MLTSISRPRDTTERTKFRIYFDQVISLAHPDKPKRKPCFYDLPAEIRLIVYDYILDGHSEQKPVGHDPKSKGSASWNSMLKLLGKEPPAPVKDTLFADRVTTRQIPHLRITATLQTSTYSASLAYSFARAYRTQVISNARRIPPITAASKLIRREILPLFFKRFSAMSTQENVPWFARHKISDIRNAETIALGMNQFLCEQTTRFVYHQGPIIITLANGTILPDAKSSAALCAENPYSDTNVHDTNVHKSPLWSMNLSIVNAEFAFTPPYDNDIAMGFNEHRSPILFDESDPRRPGVGFVTDFGEGLLKAILRYTDSRQKFGGSATAVVKLWEQCRHWEVQMMRNAVLRKGRWVLDADLRISYWGRR